MKLNEEDIILLAKKYFNTNLNNSIKGIGDDTAVFKPSKTNYELFTSDMLVEDVHFTLKTITPYNLGWKSLAVNISDVASMGGIPTCATLSIGLNNKINYSWLEEFYRGIRDCALEYSVDIVGGDTVSSPHSIIINISLLGKTNKAVYRNNIKNNYVLASTGELGNSYAGLWVLQNIEKNFSEDELYCIEKHTKPMPRVKEGIFLSSNTQNLSMLDSSDSLYTSMKILCEQSNLGIKIFEDNLPISKQTKAIAKKANINPIDFTIYGGEDYELIIALPRQELENMQNEYIRMFNSKLIYMGEFTENSNEITLVTKNQSINLKDESFKHF